MRPCTPGQVWSLKGITLLDSKKQAARLSATLSPLQRLVETAMLAAVSGLAYTLATIFRVDVYLGYFLPMPIFIAAMRSGAGASRRTVSATCFLLLGESGNCYRSSRCLVALKGPAASVPCSFGRGRGYCCTWIDDLLCSTARALMGTCKSL